MVYVRFARPKQKPEPKSAVAKNADALSRRKKNALKAALPRRLGFMSKQASRIIRRKRSPVKSLPGKTHG
jgi:hypothetical protein